MQIDKSQYPLVFLRETVLPHKDNPEAELEAILAEYSPFILISDHPPRNDDAEPPESKKARALFFKRNKTHFIRNCAGAIVIEGAKPTPMPLRLAAQAVGKAFGVSFHFVPDEEAAVALGKRLLTNASAGKLVKNPSN
ncbi:MAG: hypothetical protein ACOYJQ_18470 [Pseudochelatococcus sp.]|jgi:hypothetical protein|uniref:hypothetical protein n=1 Tax=Pseudochelatococcus sp. TaxID=2020869 RepID=UPI003D9054EE